MSTENLKAVALVVRIIRELGRYHGFVAQRRRRCDPRPADAEMQEPLAFAGNGRIAAPRSLRRSMSRPQSSRRRKTSRRPARRSTLSRKWRRKHLKTWNTRPKNTRPRPFWTRLSNHATGRTTKSAQRVRTKPSPRSSPRRRRPPQRRARRPELARNWRSKPLKTLIPRPETAGTRSPLSRPKRRPRTWTPMDRLPHVTRFSAGAGAPPSPRR